MALQMGLSKALILIGAGYTGSVLIRNGKMSDILGDLKSLLKNVEKSGDSSAESDSALVAQLDRLSREVQRMANQRPITVISGSSNQGGNLSSLILPAASLGAVGYGYMWWKGLSFSDLMYVTKRNMATAVTNMTKHLEQVSAALAAAKHHLTQRIQVLDGKLDEQKELSKEIQNEVTDARGKLINIGYDLNSLQQLVCGLNGRMDSMEYKQDVACAGVLALCQFVNKNGGEVPSEFLESATKISSKRGSLGFSEAASLKGLKHLTETIEPANSDKRKASTAGEITVDSSYSQKVLMRTVSTRS